MQMRLVPAHNIATISLLVFFPLFFYYHVAIGLYSMPAFWGGWFGPSLVLLTPGLFCLQWWRYLRGYDQFTYIDAGFWTLCFYILIWSTVHHVLGDDTQRRSDVLGQVVYATGAWVSCYVTFRQLDFRDVHLRWALGLLFIGMLVLAFNNQVSGFFYVRRLAEDGEGVASYQGFARSAFVTAVILLSISKRRYVPFIWGAGTILLYLLGARSEFAAFGIVGTFQLLSRLRSFVIVVVAILLSVLLLLTVVDGNEWSDYVNNRIVRLANLDQDRSYNARQQLQQYAVESIRNSPVFGDYGSHVRDRSLGGHSHNLLSAWVAYGLVGCVLFVIMLSASLIIPIGSMKAKQLDQRVLLTSMAFAMYSAIMAIASKSVFWVGYGIAWGCVARILDDSRKGGNYQVWWNDNSQMRAWEG